MVALLGSGLSPESSFSFEATSLARRAPDPSRTMMPVTSFIGSKRASFTRKGSDATPRPKHERAEADGGQGENPPFSAGREQVLEDGEKRSHGLKT